jgi:hypothetical protein
MTRHLQKLAAPVIRSKLTASVILLISVSSWSQTAGTGSATTKGRCSPAVTGSKNTFVINCGIDQKQGQEMLTILNRILAEQLDPNAVMRKLDEILGAVSTTGNLRDRALGTSMQILTDLWSNGLPVHQGGPQPPVGFVVIHQMPADKKEQTEWATQRLKHFDAMYRTVAANRDELRELHLSDDSLNRLLLKEDERLEAESLEREMQRLYRDIGNASNIKSETTSLTAEWTLMPQEIEEVAERLMALAQKVPSQH